MATHEMLISLPKLADDGDVGKQREHAVRRDDQPDIAFTGTLKASAAPPNRGQERWREYRVYETKAGHLVLSRVGRSVRDGERDKFEAQIFKRNQALLIGDTTYVPADVSGGTNFFTEGKPMKAVIVDYFGFDDLAKEIYRKLGVSTETTLD